MAFHPAISIRYADDDPSKEKTRVERVVRTYAPQKQKKKMSLFAKAKGLFNSFISKFTGRKSSNIQNEDSEVEAQDWIIEEDVVTGKGKFNWKQLQPQLVMIARDIVQTHVINLANPYPPASKPGQFPAMRTGALARSITWKWRGNTWGNSKKRIIDVGYKDIAGKTGNPAEYSQYLHQRGRLSIGESAQQVNPRTTEDGLEVIWEMDGNSA